MKKSIKTIISVIATAAIVTTLSLTTAFAGEWKRITSVGGIRMTMEVIP